MAREHELIFRLNAQMNSAYQTTFREAQAAMGSLREEYNALAHVAKDIAGYERQQKAVENTRDKLALLETQYANIQKEINETGTFSSDLENKLAAKGAQIEKTTSALSDQEEKLRQYEDALRAAGVDTNDLQDASARLKSEMDGLREGFNGAQQGAEQLAASGMDALMDMQGVLAGAGLVALSKELADQLKTAAEASAEFEAGMAAVRRTVGGSREEIDALGDEFQQMAAVMPITTGELSEIATTAGQLGIAQENVKDFTLVMAQLATTTDLSADNAATMLAQFSNITNTSDYARLGATVAALGDSTATTASRIVDMSQGMAAAASVAGMSAQDILGISAAVGALGIRSQMGATAMSQLITKLYLAIETGEDLEMYAEVANMTAQEFKRAWGEDAAGALNTFIQGLNDTERHGKSAIAVLNDIGITNARQLRVFTGLAESSDRLTSSIALANRSWAENTALAEKAEIMYDTTRAKMVTMQNEVNNLRIAVGDQFNPALGKLYEFLGKAAGGMADFVEENPGVVRALGATAVALGTVTAGLGAAIVAFKAFDYVAKTSIGPAGWVMMGISAVVGLAAGLTTLAATADHSEDELYNMTEAIKTMEQAMADANEQMRSAETDTMTAAMAVGRYIDRMEALEEAGTATNASQWEYRAILDEINRIMPGVNAAIDEQTGLVQGGAASLRDLADGWKQAALAQVYYEAYTEKAKAYYAVQKDVNDAQEKLLLLQDKLPASLDEIEAKQRALNFVQAKYNSLTQEGIGDFDTYEKLMFQYDDQITTLQENIESLYGSMTKEERAALAEQDELNAAISAGREAMNNYAAEMAGLEDEMSGLADANREGADSFDSILGPLTDVLSELDTLGDAYADLYTEAMDSIEGQFTLWEEVPEVVATSAEEIRTALETQQQYWEDYTQNLQDLTGRNIEGLDGMVASIADGSTKSAGYIAGLAALSNSDLESIVAAWQSLGETETAAGEELFDLKSNYEAALEEMVGKVEDAVGSMDLSYDARQAARQTVNAYIEAAEGMVGYVRSAYAAVAGAARDALSYGNMTVVPRNGNIGSVGYNDGYNYGFGAAGGTDNAPRGWRWVGEQGPELMWFGGGETVVPHTKSVEMLHDAQATQTISVTLAPSYQISGVGNPEDIRAILEEHDRALPDMITAILRDQKRDAVRRSLM